MNQEDFARTGIKHDFPGRFAMVDGIGFADFGGVKKDIVGN
jgi:hypothetical protein